MTSHNQIKKTVNQLLRTSGIDTPSQVPTVNNTTTFSTFSPIEYRNLMTNRANTSSTAGTTLENMLNSLRNNSSEFENWEREIEELKELTPEIDDAADITISSIFSPTDMQATDLQVTTENTGLGAETEESINKLLTKHFNEKFHLTERATEWAKTARFGTGATGIFLMPAKNIETLNTLSDAKTKGLYAPGRQIDQDVKIGHESLSMEAFETDIESSVESWVTGSKESLEQTYENMDQIMISSCESMISSITDEINTKRKRQESGELNTSQVVHKQDLAKAIRNLFIDNKSVRFHSDLSIFEKSLTQTNRAADAVTKRAFNRIFGNGRQNSLYVVDPEFDDSKDNCVVVEFDGSIIIPIVVPNDPSKLIGCIALVDQWGSPLSRQITDDYYRGGSRTLNEANSRSLNAKSVTSQFCSEVSDRQRFDISANMFTTAMKLMIQTKMSEYGLGHVDIEEHSALGSCLFNYLLKDNKIGMVFIPASFMVYFAYEYHPNGMGKSLIEGISTIIALRNTMTMAGIMASAENSVNNRTIEVNVDEKNANPLQTLELVRNMYIDKKVVKLNHNPMDIQRGLYNKALTLLPKNLRGVKDNLTTTIEHKPTGAVQPDENLRDMLTKWIISKLKVPHSAMNDISQNDFARAVVLNNLLFNNKVHILQRKTEVHLNKFVKIYTSFSSELITEIKEIIRGVNLNDKSLQKDKTAINGELKGKIEFNDDTKINKYVELVISNMEVKLPKPRAVVDSAQYAELEKYIGAAERVINDIYPDEFISAEGNYRDVYALRKAKIKSDLIRQVIADVGFQSNYTLPKIQDISIEDIEDLLRTLVNDKREINDVMAIFAHKINSKDADGSNIKPYGTEINEEQNASENNNDDGTGTPNDLEELGSEFNPNEEPAEAKATGPVETGGTPEEGAQPPEGTPPEEGVTPEAPARRRTPPEELTFPTDDQVNPPEF